MLLLLFAFEVRSSDNDQEWLALTPVPYQMKLPAGIAERVSVQDQPTDAAKSGAVAVVTLSYKPIEGEKAWFMTAYYFTERDLDKTIFPDEVPPYGLKLMTRDGMALSVLGPQESIYQPNSQDGKNFATLHDIFYNKDSYRPIG